MRGLVLEPTATAQWQALVTEAETLAHRPLDENLESYLVFTLMRFTQQPALASSILSLEFLNGLQQSGHLRQEQLRDVGDKCLLFSGLFPHLAKRRLVKISFFVDLGRSAYQQVQCVSPTGMAQLYGQLATDFVSLMDVLHAMRELDDQHPALDTLSNFELWEDTGSEQARAQLQRRQPQAIPVRGNHGKVH
ncbi:MAG: hypothetical protein HY272_13210 [Gammaproteobacteria bacterium]|nr:hypothetical protein [Gammaproteobacteria bacterium]